MFDVKGNGPTPEIALTVRVEDHSRNLKRLRDPQPGDANTPENRSAALEIHRAALEADFRQAATAHGLALSAEAPWRLELTVSSLGEVRSSYIVYGIGSGVAWGLGTGLIAHNTALALGLGGYELVEESAFWILGASLFGSFSAPAVVEARLFQDGHPKAIWSETYYVLNGRKLLKATPEPLRHRREVQLRASLDRVIEKVFQDLEPMLALPHEIDYFPSQTKATPQP